MAEEKRLLVVACEVLARELSHAAASAPRAVDLVMLSQGLHEVEKPGMARELITDMLEGYNDDLLREYQDKLTCSLYEAIYEFVVVRARGRDLVEGRIELLQEVYRFHIPR